METVYTAAGKISLQRHGDVLYPVIRCNGTEKQITRKEMILWSILVNTVMTKSQLEMSYKEKATQFFEENDTFFEILHRLEERNLIVRGKGETNKEAIYDLLKGVYMTPIKINLLFKISGFFYLWFCKKIPFSQSIHVFKKYKLTKQERYILDLVKKGIVSAFEILEHIKNEKQNQWKKKEDFLNEAVFSKKEDFSEEIKTILHLYERGFFYLDVLYEYET